MVLATLSSLGEHQLLVFWVQLAVLVCTARLLGGLMRRIGQPAVIGELAAGLLLGPSVFGKVWPSGFHWFLPDDPMSGAAIVAVGWIGAALLLVVTGFETDLQLIRRFGRAAAFVGTGSLVVPFAGGLAVGFALPEEFFGHGTTRLVFALFIATALSISSLPVIAKILSELHLMRRNFGQINLAAGMANDTVGWLLLGVISGLAASGKVSVGRVLDHGRRDARVPRGLVRGRPARHRRGSATHALGGRRRRRRGGRVGGGDAGPRRVGPGARRSRPCSARSWRASCSAGRASSTRACSRRSTR